MNELTVEQAQQLLIDVRASAANRIADAEEALERAMTAARGSRPAWAPMPGFGSVVDAPGSPRAVEFAAACEVARRQACAYSGGSVDVRCDCKFGAGEKVVSGHPRAFSSRGEQTGCPELRAVITYLLGPA